MTSRKLVLLVSHIQIQHFVSHRLYLLAKQMYFYRIHTQCQINDHYRVKYRKQPFNLNKKITIQFKNNPINQKGNRTASLHETINLWTIVKSSCFAHDHDHGFKTKKKNVEQLQEYNDDFFLNNIDSVANPFKYIFVHMRQKKHSKSCRLCDAKISSAMIQLYKTQ